MSCLITGGAGFIGSHLTEALVAAGHHVRILDDFSSGRLANLDAVAGRIELVRGGVTDLAAVRQVMRGIRWVFHLAAIPSVQRSLEEPLTTHDVCVTGTLN